MKTGIITGVGAIGAAVTTMCGGWNSAITTLVIFMAIDYISGLVCAGVFHKSNKTTSGTLESRAGLKGICRKAMMLVIVIIACRLDMITGTSYIKDMAVIALIANECISIVENAGLMGVPIPPAITKAIDVLTKKEDEDVRY